MYSMFSGADAFDADISGWDVGRVTTFEGMFFRANAFTQDLSKWKHLERNKLKIHV